MTLNGVAVKVSATKVSAGFTPEGPQLAATPMATDRRSAWEEVGLTAVAIQDDGHLRWFAVQANASPCAPLHLHFCTYRTRPGCQPTLSSGPSNSNFRVDRLQLNACVIDFHLPDNASLLGIGIA